MRVYVIRIKNYSLKLFCEKLTRVTHLNSIIFEFRRLSAFQWYMVCHVRAPLDFCLKAAHCGSHVWFLQMPRHENAQS